MDKLECIRIFQRVADCSSFAEAARQLQIAPVTATRAVAALEEDLGVQLLMRTTRSVTLTEPGMEYLNRSRLALGELDEAARQVRGEVSDPRGSLVITAPVMFGRNHILPIVTEILHAHPELMVKLILTDRVLRLVEEGIDAAIRIGHLRDSALRALPLTEVRRELVASPLYLEKRGTPTKQAELAEHDLIAFDTVTLNSEWPRVGNKYRVEPRLLTNSADATIEAALMGLGIARVFSYHAADDIEQGRLVRVMSDVYCDRVPVNLVYHGNRQRSANLSTFVKAVRAAFAGTVVV